MNEKYDVPCREIVTKERLYERLDEAILECRIKITKEDTRLETLLDVKRNLNEYFEDLEKAESEGVQDGKKKD